MQEKNLENYDEFREKNGKKKAAGLMNAIRAIENYRSNPIVSIPSVSKNLKQISVELILLFFLQEFHSNAMASIENVRVKIEPIENEGTLASRGLVETGVVEKNDDHEDAQIIAELLSVKKENNDLHFNYQNSQRDLKVKLVENAGLQTKTERLQTENSLLKAQVEQLRHEIRQNENSKVKDFERLQTENSLLKDEVQRLHLEIRQKEKKKVPAKNIGTEKSKKKRSHATIEDSDDNLYLVEAVLAKRIKRGRQEYLIKWKNYDEKFNTWEPEDNLKNTVALKKFHKLHDKNKKATKCRK